MPYGEIECSNLARGVSRANLVALCTNSYADWRIWLPYGDYKCRMAILATLWRIPMPISECGCPKAIMNANWPFWLHYSEFECRLVILAALSAKLNDLFIRAHALCAKLNDLSLLLHALSAKLDGKTYIISVVGLEFVLEFRGWALQLSFIFYHWAMGTLANPSTNLNPKLYPRVCTSSVSQLARFL